MSIDKFAAGTTLATPAIGGVSYVTYEQLTKEETESSTSEEGSTSQSEAGSKATGEQDQTNKNLEPAGLKSPRLGSDSEDETSEIKNPIQQIPGEGARQDHQDSDVGPNDTPLQQEVVEVAEESKTQETDSLLGTVEA